MSVHNYMDLSGRVAVVLGGTSGLGRTLALGLAKAGADVVVTGRRENLIDEVATEIEALGRRTLRQTCDVMDRDQIVAFRDQVVATLGSVDILLNAAGKTIRKPTINMTVDEWHSVMDTNLTSMVVACQVFHEPLEIGRAHV